MKKITGLFLAASAIGLMACSDVATSDQKVGPNAEMVENDPTALHLYTLDNGLKVYLSKNTDEPKIQTYIAVRAGSVYDPADNTGLAHYLEHMLFKGTDEIGTQNWEEEKVVLKQISNLYEAHKAEKDPVKKGEIYKQIDSVSNYASTLAIANEYDKMVSSLGAEGTNAHTWHEETIYKNKIPSNELEKWLKLESERFSQLVLRLFHTELEAVYEEFNRSQDNDWRKSHYAMMKELFPNHPYGQQNTIGVAEHLKNPSMENIHAYFEKYYVPNNMAVVLVGDIEYDAAYALVDKYFGSYASKEVAKPVLPKEDPIIAPVRIEVVGPTAARVSFAYRFDGIGSEDEAYVTMIDMMLSNGQAGLIDLNLNKNQKVQRAGCSPSFMNDYGYHSFNGSPLEGQSLEEVEALIHGEIEKIKKGEFEEWMLEAAINDMKLNRIRRYENSTAVASAYYNAFIHFQDWETEVKKLEELRKLTKDQLVAFANEHYKDNYVVVYKRTGENEGVVKVENPGITPIELNRDKSSEFLTAFNQMESGKIMPDYVDFEKEIKEVSLNSGIEVEYIENKTNDLFYLAFLFDLGKDHDKELPIAVDYLAYLGTDSYSVEELTQEFYKLGISYGVRSGSDESYIYLRGLKENLPAGLELVEHLMTNAKVDTDAYKKMVGKIEKGRKDAKLSKGNILRGGLSSFAKHGEKSRLRDNLSSKELLALDPSELVKKAKNLSAYKHRVFYYGKDVDNAVVALNKMHKAPKERMDMPVAKDYPFTETGKKVYFVDYDMVQAEIMFLSKGNTFDPATLANGYMFNSFYGSGLSSIVFQEIRESKSLAYSAYSSFRQPNKKEDPSYLVAYMGTQVNKLPEAIDAMMDLLNNMPDAQQQFDAAKEATLKQIAAQRITKAGIFWKYESLKDLGITSDNREEVYKAIQGMTLEDFAKFFDGMIKGSEYTVVVIGNKKDLDMEALAKLGEVKEMDIDYLFNY